METPGTLKMEQLKKKLAVKDKELAEKNKELAEKNKELAEKNKELAETKEMIKKLNEKVQDSQRFQIDQLELNAEKEESIAELENFIETKYMELSSQDTEPANNSDPVLENQIPKDIKPKKKKRSKLTFSHINMGTDPRFKHFDQTPSVAITAKTAESPPTYTSENFPSLPEKKSVIQLVPSCQMQAVQKNQPWQLPTEKSSNPVLLPVSTTVIPSNLLSTSQSEESKPTSILLPDSTQENSPLPMPSTEKSKLDLPKKIIIYADSNLNKLPRYIIAKIKLIRKYSAEEPSIEIIPTYTMQKTHKVVQTNDHTDALVIIAIMTNNARRKEPVMSVYNYQEEIIAMLKTETGLQNIVFVACPPSTKFNTYAYNKSTEYLCMNEQVRFARSLISKGNLNNDGYHVRFEYQHLMSQTIAAVVMNVDPFEAFKMRPNSWGRRTQPQPLPYQEA